MQNPDYATSLLAKKSFSLEPNNVHRQTTFFLDGVFVVIALARQFGGVSPQEN